MRLGQLLRRILQPPLWWAYRRYNRSGHWHRIDGLRIYTGPSVFHPRWFLTTRTLTDFALQRIQPKSSVLELGAGNGVLALSCARKGAVVTATDINPTAISSIEQSAAANQLEVRALESDLFAAIMKERFDFIFVNPPYFPGKPTNDQERAFLCGEDYSYFKRFFAQWETVAPSSETYMILTDACELNAIKAIAQENGCEMKEVLNKASWGEEHLIFQLQSLAMN